MPSRFARALSSIRAAITNPPSFSRGLRGGVFLKSRANPFTFSSFISYLLVREGWFDQTQSQSRPLAQLHRSLRLGAENGRIDYLLSDAADFKRDRPFQWRLFLEAMD